MQIVLMKLVSFLFSLRGINMSQASLAYWS